MKRNFLITEEERSRILNLHKTATKKHYLFEQSTITDEDKIKLGEETIKRLNYLLIENRDVFSEYLNGKTTAEGTGSFTTNSSNLTISNVTKGTFYVGGGIKTDQFFEGNLPRIIKYLKNELGDDVPGNQQNTGGGAGTYLLDKTFPGNGENVRIFQGEVGLKYTDKFNRDFYDNEGKFSELLQQYQDNPSGMGEAIYEMNPDYFEKTECFSTTTENETESGTIQSYGKNGPGACRVNSTDQCFKITFTLDRIINNLIIKYELDQNPQKGQITQWQCD
jgi:hypothetical protein